MLTLKGKLANVYEKAGTTDPDTGEVRPSQKRAQVMVTEENGKMEFIDLKINDISAWSGMDGKEIVVPVKMWSSASGGSSMHGLYVDKMSKPRLVTAAK